MICGPGRALYITHFYHALELSCDFINDHECMCHHVHDVSIRVLGIVALPGRKWPCHPKQTSQAKADKPEDPNANGPEWNACNACLDIGYKPCDHVCLWLR